MNKLSRSVLIATVFSASITILTSILAYYFRSILDTNIVERITVLANNPSTNIQNIRSIVEQLAMLARSFVQIANGVFIYAIWIGIISTLLFFSIYIKLKKMDNVDVTH